MQFDGSFTVLGRAGDVMVKFTDVERMAKCMPGAQIEEKTGDNSYVGSMTVAFGPKRIKFKGSVECDFDLANNTGQLTGRGAADMRAARIQLATDFSVRDNPEAVADTPTCTVTLHSEAQLTGVLASLASTGGEAIAKVLLTQFEQNLAAELTGNSPDAGTGTKAVPAGKVAWQAVRQSVASRFSKPKPDAS